MFPYDVDALGAMVRSDQLRLVPHESPYPVGSTSWYLHAYCQDAANPEMFWGSWVIYMGRTRPQEWR